MELDDFGKKLFLVGILKSHSLRTQTSDDRRYVCVRKLKDSEKTISCSAAHMEVSIETRVP